MLNRFINVFILALALFPLRAIGQQRSSPTKRVQHTKETNRKEEPRNKLPEVQKPPSTTIPSDITQPDVQREPDRQTENRPYLQKLRDYLKAAFSLNNLSNWFLFAVGAIGVGFAYKTLRALLRQTKATEMAADAAKSGTEAALAGAKAAQDSVEMFISKERARLRVELGKIKFEIDQSVHTVPIIVRRFGPTDAFITDTGITAFLSVRDRIIPDFSPMPIPDYMSSNQKELPFSIVVDKIKLMPREIDGVENGELILNVRGFIEYTDVFDRGRETSFALVWNAIKVPGFDGYWSHDGDQDNYET